MSASSHFRLSRLPLSVSVSLPRAARFWHASYRVSKGRLTRQELGWLLTQEAQGAAERLRKGVTALKSNAPPKPDSQFPEPGVGVETTLAALDDAMRMLSNLHKAPVSVRGRRGRIDLASLMWEVAPEARVSIEPGSGTEVFGDEAELRRMLHVLLGHGSGSGSAVTIRRNGDEVRVSVTLGPDSSATAETERAWLSRMAIRYGGRYDLEGSLEVLSLPADGVDERNEREALRKELDEARKQGEAYARELAQVFAAGEEPAMQSSYPPPLASPAAERITTMTRMAGGVAAVLRGMLSPVTRELQELRALAPNPRRSSPDLDGAAVDLDEKLETMRRRLRSVQDFVGELAQISELDAAEGQVALDLVEQVKAAARALEPRAQRAGVEIKVVATSERAAARTAMRGTMVLLREIIAHAIDATPRERALTVTVGAEGAGAGEGLGSRVIVDDSGTSLPGPSRRALLALEVEPGTYGRPSAIPLYVANEICGAQGAVMEIADSPSGGVRVIVTFPR
jgi:signal transduction histidine kinase